jgi:hypothetical protein
MWGWSHSRNGTEAEVGVLLDFDLLGNASVPGDVHVLHKIHPRSFILDFLLGPPTNGNVRVRIVVARSNCAQFGNNGTGDKTTTQARRGV